MASLETNIYQITNLGDLSTRYRLVDVIGLHRDQAEYYRNRELLQRKLSYRLRVPAAAVEHDGALRVAVPHDVSVIPGELALVRQVVQLRLREEVLSLDYTLRTPANDLIALRFLRFLVQAPLYHDARLWQQGAGRPFFSRTPAAEANGIGCYSGFAVRPVATHDGGVGLCVDVAACYLGFQPLSGTLDRDEFNRRWKGRKCVYRFGDRWYEVRLHALADRTASTYRFDKDGRRWTLLDYVRAQVARPLASDVAGLTDEAAVVTYLDNRGNELGAPAPLCYPVYDTSSEHVARLHARNVLAPPVRRERTKAIVDTYLRELRFGKTTLKLENEPLQVPHRHFAMPDLRFGHDTVLSVRGTPRAVCVGLDDFGARRLTFMKDRRVGLYKPRVLDRQYLFLPQTVADTFGARFSNDLAATVGEFYHHEGGYAPTWVPYDDRGARTFVRLGLAIRAAAAEACKEPGYALVMLHSTCDRRDGREDPLTAMVIRELHHRWDVRAAVIHSDVARRAYREGRADDGRVEYRCVPNERGRLAGYLRNVAITKVLLTNQHWPFVLASSLHADLTVGVDVKNNTAGLFVVGARGSAIRSVLRESRQKERLLRAQMASYMYELLRFESEARESPLTSFAVQRDGRLWPEEIVGIRQTKDRLEEEGYLAEGGAYALLEIQKSAPAPFRMYEHVVADPGHVRVDNPSVGALYVPTDSEAYLCTTGRPFLKQGTARPLHVRLVEGTIPFVDCLEDVYGLSALTWTQPEGCARYPITMRLNDRILRSEAGEYDEDALAFAEHSGGVDEGTEVA